MAKVCDVCGDRSKVAFDTTAITARTIPGDGTRQHKASTDKINRYRLGELCEECGHRYDLAIGNLIASLKTGETPLPDLSPAEPEQEQPAAEEPTEQQPELPLGGTDEDSGTVEEPLRNEMGSAPYDTTVERFEAENVPVDPAPSSRKRNRSAAV
jgi:hypothetical protein